MGRILTHKNYTQTMRYVFGTIGTGARGCDRDQTTRGRRGFTLIELSIVLVIIALLVGGVIVGQDLIAVAKIRSQISQLDKYTAAVNTFRLKYNGMPGDLPANQAATFNFTTGTGTAGDGDGNGLVEMITGQSGYAQDPWVNPLLPNAVPYSWVGELRYFWTQLSQANLIDGTYTSTLPFTSAQTGIDIPFSKIDAASGIVVFAYKSANYYQLGIGFDPDPNNNPGVPLVYPSLTGAEAYGIDNKIDDGVAGTGKVVSRLAVMDPASANLPNLRPSKLAGGKCTMNANTKASSGLSGSTPANLLVYDVSTPGKACSIRIEMP